jgi:hypothetical protein
VNRWIGSAKARRSPIYVWRMDGNRMSKGWLMDDLRVYGGVGG